MRPSPISDDHQLRGENWEQQQLEGDQLETPGERTLLHPCQVTVNGLQNPNNRLVSLVFSDYLKTEHFLSVAFSNFPFLLIQLPPQASP